jgi:3',5'-cyclic AMP phosphodiesterase CpdA
MRTLVHLSDLHFGRVDEVLLDPLVACVESLAPDVVVVSGDLTQRAKNGQFEDASRFLARLPRPQIVVPGNHDVPLYNVFDRLLRPLAKYKRHIGPELAPSHVDSELAVFGLNTARSLVVKNGRVNPEQLQALRDAMSGLPLQVVRVVVTHHPFDVAPTVDEDQRVGRASQAMKVFAECGVDVLLAGHLHVSHSADTGDRYALAGYEALVVSAGTATSTRGRGEVNSFNVMRLDKPRIEVERWQWQSRSGRFERASVEVFIRQDRGWIVANTPAHPTP